MNRAFFFWTDARIHKMLGFHVSRKNGKARIPESLTSAISTLREYGFSPAAQIFVTGPQGYRETLTLGEREAVAKIIKQERIPLVIHGAYVDNPWGCTPNPVRNIAREMSIAADIGATGVIVHLAEKASLDENLNWVLEKLGEMPEAVKTLSTLWLEIHTAKQSDATYETPEKLTRLFERVAAANRGGLRVGLCIDTAHLYACGVSLATRDAARDWLSQLPDIPVMLHLNDSASTIGSGKDKHEVLCEGNIWREYHPVSGSLPVEDSGLVAVLDWAELKNIVVILERDEDGIVHDLTLLSALGYFRSEN